MTSPHAFVSVHFFSDSTNGGPSKSIYQQTQQHNILLFAGHTCASLERRKANVLLQTTAGTYPALHQTYLVFATHQQSLADDCACW